MNSLFLISVSLWTEWLKYIHPVYWVFPSQKPYNMYHNFFLKEHRAAFQKDAHVSQYTQEKGQQKI